MSDEYQKHFEELGLHVEDPIILNKCIELASNYGYTEKKDLIKEWELYAINNKTISTNTPLLPSKESFEKFAQHVASKHLTKKKKQKEIPHLTKTSTLISQDGINQGGLFGLPPKKRLIVQDKVDKTPQEKKMVNTEDTMDIEESTDANNTSNSSQPTISKQNPSESKPSTYSQRKNIGQILMTHNLHIEKKSYNNQSIQIHIEETSQLERYTYMWEKMEHIVKLIDDRIESIGNFILEKNDLGKPIVFDIQSQEPSISVGMVCSEAEGQFKSVVLQSSTQLKGVPFQVKLDLIELNEYDLFPGQVIAIRGTNPYGTHLIVNNLYTNATRPLRKPSKLPSGLKVIATAGPYTSPDNLDYKPLEDLLKRVNQEKPDLLILMGPFLDSNNSVIKSCNTEDKTFAELFVVNFLERLNLEHLKKISCKVVLVPSLRDVHHDCIFPQFPMDEDMVKSLGDCSHVTFAPNPCTLVVNEVSFGICTNDILFHLSKQAVTKKTESQNIVIPKLQKMAQLLIHQQSYYPLWPGVSSETEDGENSLICSAQASKLSMPYTPDVLLLSSVLSYFVYDISGSLCINTNRLGFGFNVYTILHIDPLNDFADHRTVAQRTRAEIEHI